MADRKHGEPAPKTDNTVAGADWYGRDLDRQRHQATLFVDLDLTEARNIGSTFNDCTFRRARFNASSHRSVPS